MGIFEQASRERIRFNTTYGNISAEDLWALPMSSTSTELSLNEIFKVLNREFKDSEEEGLISQNKKNELLELKLDIVKHIFNIKKEELDIKVKELQNDALRKKIKAIKERKKDADLEALSIEELEEMEKELK